MADVKNKNEIYKCSVCGNIVEVLHAGGGELVCCGKPMEFLEAKTEDEGMEKHVPVIEKTDDGVLVKVGEVPHPMTEEHHISWIQVITKDGKAYRKNLEHTGTPEAEFCVNEEEISEVREYCNVHGLWKK